MGIGDWGLGIGVGDLYWGLGLGLGIWIGDWGWGLGLRLRIEIGDWGLGIGIRDWDSRLGLRIGIGN